MTPTKTKAIINFFKYKVKSKNYTVQYKRLNGTTRILHGINENGYCYRWENPCRMIVIDRIIGNFRTVNIEFVDFVVLEGKRIKFNLYQIIKFNLLKG